jgi:hypothetical protein
MLTRSLSALAVVLAGTATARADTLVFPVEGADGAASARLTRALLAAAEDDRPRLADTALGEAASLLECSAAERACLDSMAQAMNASALLAASVRPAGGTQLAARITYHRRGEAPRTRDVELPADPEAAAPVLERQARALIAGDSAPAADPPSAPAAAAAPVTSAGAAPGERDTGAGFSFGRVRPWTWAVAGTGVVLLGVGAVFAGKASGLEDDVNAAPRDTVADLEHLRDLEDEGEQATSISNALLLGGGVAALAGAGLILWQGFTPSAEERGRALTLSPAPLRGGAGLVLSGVLP